MKYNLNFVNYFWKFNLLSIMLVLISLIFKILLYLPTLFFSKKENSKFYAYLYTFKTFVKREFWYSFLDKLIVEIDNPNIIHIGKRYIVELAATADGIKANIDNNSDWL